MGFSRQEYWSGLLFPSPRDLPDPGMKPGSPALQADSSPSEPSGKPIALRLKLLKFGMLRRIACYLPSLSLNFWYSFSYSQCFSLREFLLIYTHGSFLSHSIVFPGGRVEKNSYSSLRLKQQCLPPAVQILT